MVVGRTEARIPSGSVLSSDSYFNRVNAGYWQRWAGIQSMTARIGGVGLARMAIRRSTPGGYETTLRVIEGDLAVGLECAVDLSVMAGGGTLWMDLEPMGDEIVVRDGRWETVSDRPVLTTDIAVCTYNRPHDVLALLRSLRRDPECQAVIDTVWVIDNGTEHFSDLPGGQEVLDAWGSDLRHVRQKNLGGSGGFARGQFESAYHGNAPFVVLLDDDVVVEPEGIRRAVVLASLASTPIAVGGQMLNRAKPTQLHASAEWVKTKNLRYGPAPGGREDVDLNSRREEYVLDAAYNAWWCCLVPTDAIRDVGLGMPFFIKYDDVEYGYRLAKGGYRTVTMPGVAVWHEPFALKDDTTDWTLYFHVRNRLIFAAVMSAHLPPKVQSRRVSAVISDVLKRDVLRNVLRRAFASAASAEMAMRDFLQGPGVLTEPLHEVVERVRAGRRGYPDAVTDVPTGGRGDRPTSVHRTRPPRIPLALPLSVVREFGIPVPKVLPVPPSLLKSRQVADEWRIWEMPDPDARAAELPKVADHWWGLFDLDDAWVTTIDGSKVTRRTRDPLLARDLTKRSWRTAKEVKAEFPRLALEYAAAVPDLTSPHTWAKQFGIEVDQ